MTSTLPPLVQAVAGAIGSASANTLTYPLDLVTTRKPLGSNSPHVFTKRLSENSTRFKAVRILRSIIQSDGVGALYDGLFTDTASTLISNFFYFYIYSLLRKILIRRVAGSQSSIASPLKSTKPLPSIKLAIWQDLALGFMSGVASRVVSMPLSIITLRLQTGRHDDSDESGIVDQEENGNAMIQTVKKIYEEQGFSGFWRGFNTSILLSLNPSITLAFFQLFRRLLALIRRRHSDSQPALIVDPTPGEAFFGGAISNSIAVALLYPLILSKTRLQASRSKSTAFGSSESQSASRPKTLGAVMLDAYHGRYHHGTSSTSSTSDKQVRRASGINSLYQGLEMQILKGFLNQGVTFLVKGRIEQLLIEAYMRHKRLGASKLSTITNLPLLPTISMPFSNDPHRSLEAWNIVEHVGRRYL
ncbi:mitochondrial carrier domain-containing protein [Lentinula novae-zelandiae]|nr:mitochondrial carrier domain-containing protein [Lentinula novae-zelandiae]